MKYIASCSFGKDSLAMVLRLLEENRPLDEVVFYDTGMEFQAIYDNLTKMRDILFSKNIEMIILTPEINFLSKAFDIRVRNRDGSGWHNGYSWCGGRCRWGTTDKLKSLDNYAEDDPAYVYVGIAVDEAERVKKERKFYKLLPLVDWQMTEADCLQYCYDRGWNWLEESPVTESGYIDLYKILDRVSCWCCANKNRKELKNIYRYLPQYWQRLKEFQDKTERPMKRFCNKKYGEYGDVFQMEKVFEQEEYNGDKNSIRR